jgi:hypothetical protein
MKKCISEIRVYFDGGCPKCIKDRDNYLRIAGKHASNVHWIDINHNEQELAEEGVLFKEALRSLHIKVRFVDHEVIILKGLEAYEVLMHQTQMLKPFAWLISLRMIKPILSYLYRARVYIRLKKSGRL